MNQIKQLVKQAKPHDGFFRESFVEEVALEFLLNYESSERLGLLNLDELKIEATLLDTPEGLLISDLIICVPFKFHPKQMACYCVEHQSKVDAMMPLRILGYKAAILKKSAKVDPYHLPLVHAFVLYTGEYQYPEKIGLSSLSYKPDNWGRGDGESFELIWSREAERNAKGRKYPVILKAFNSRYDKKLKRVEEIFIILSKMDSPEDRGFVNIVRRYIYRVRRENETDTIIKLELSIAEKKGGKQMRSAAECLERRGEVKAIRKYKGKYEARGRKRGMLIGRREGKLEGKLEGKEECAQTVAMLMRKEGLPEHLIDKITKESLSEVASCF